VAAEIIYFSSDAERIAKAEALGLDPDYELVSLLFPGDPEAARALGVAARDDPSAIPF
jgi:hypothetical protein